MDYWTSRTSRHSIESLLKTFREALHCILQAPLEKISDVRLIAEADKEQLRRWNSITPAANPSCIHELVRKQSTLTPNALAVCAWDGDLAYSELDDLVERLAFHLVDALGVSTATTVMICMNKSRWAIVGLLAILKAGGIVVPLGAQHPLARIRSIAKDTKSTVLLVDETQQKRLSSLVPQVLLLGQELASLPLPKLPLNTAVGPEDVAYVIYTSGSTGLPKGVVLQHRALSTSLSVHGAKFGLNHKTRALQFSAYTFDVSISDIFATLIYGGCVCVPSEDDRLNNLEGVIRSMSINFATLTSTVAGLLHPAEVPTIATIVLVGEAVRPAVINTWLGYAKLYNAYGPSESSIHASCSNQITEVEQAPVIGWPLAGCFWVTNVSNHHRLSPIGAPGELLIEGPLLSRGYLNDIHKTKSAFVTDPEFVRDLGLKMNRRMYRTGDLVQQNTDGSLIYLGRRDTQIKIRGQRVEIGEIEYHLTQHHLVSEAVVIRPQGGPCKDRLVAVLALGRSSSGPGHAVELQQIGDAEKAAMLLHASSIRQHLSQHVMEYMIPSVWIPLPTLPVNPSGKVDRLRLTRWVTSMDAESIEALMDVNLDKVSPLAPRSELEQQLQEIWSQALGVPKERIALNRSFLSLGGDSVTAMQVVSQCRRQGIMLSVRDVLQSQEIGQLSMKAASAKRNAVKSSDVTLEPFDLSPIQQLYFESIAPNGLKASGEDRFNQSVCLRTKQTISVVELAKAMDTVVAKHTMLRARFRHDRSVGWKQNIIDKASGSFRFRHHQVSGDADFQQIFRNSHRSLDLEHGPVFAAELVEQGERQILFMTAHHLVIDVVSWRILINDLAEHLQTQQVSPINSLSFQAWCSLQEEYSKGPLAVLKTLPFNVPRADWEYWGLEIGSYRHRDKVDDFVVLDQNLTSVLLGACNQAMHTEPVEILLAALFHSFSQVFPDRQVPAIFNEGHGREPWDDTIQLSDTVGWFTTMVPLHVTVDGDIVNTLKSTKDRRRQTPGRGFPYFTARFLTGEGRNMFANHGQMEVLFNYLGRHHQLEQDNALFQVEELGANAADTVSGFGNNVKQPTIFDIEAAISANEMRVRFSFSSHIRHLPAIQRWLNAFRAALKELCRRLMNMKSVVTPSDFPLAALTNQDLMTLETQHLRQLGLDDLVDVEDIYPCSPIQQGILMSQIKSPSTYQIRVMFEVKARNQSTVLDIGKMADAWQQVVDRHAILRTAFLESSSGDETFHQIVLRSWDADTHTAECKSDDDVKDQFGQLARLDYRDSRPCHRISLRKTGTGHMYGLLDISHVLVDASSISLLVQDLVQAYDGRLTSRMGPLYSSYVSYLQRRSFEEDLQYWKSFLSDAQPCYMPSSVMRENSAASKAAQLQRVVTKITDLTAIHRFRQVHGVTMASIFQLAWAVVLASHTASSEICFGYLTNGRDAPIPQVQELIGPMINMMVCFLRLDREETVLDAVKRVHENFWQSFDHQRISLADIQHSLRLSGQRLFNTTMSYKRQAAPAAQQSSSISIESVLAEDPTEYPMNVGILAADSSIEISLEYISSFASESSAARLLDNLCQAIDSLIHNENAKIRDVVIIGKEDIRQIKEWNSDVPKAVKTCLHHLVQEQSATQQAVSAWDGDLTYGELNTQSERLAHHLVSLGVKPEVKVALCLDKSKWAVVAMLSILKAGGVIVLLGVQHPVARITNILADTKTAVLLVDKHQATRLSGLVPNLIALDSSLLENLPAKQAKPACTAVRPENAAVVLYTSGSTGTPKGIVLEHAGLCTYMLSHGVVFELGSQTRVLQFSAYTFDSSVSEIFITLIHGGCVCIISEADRINNLANAMRTMNVNFADFTPSVAATLHPSEVPMLKTMLLCGETIQPAIVNRWAEHVRILNCYGPAECSINSAVSRPLRHKSQSSNIGFGVGTRLWVVDRLDYHRLCPIGVPGELLIEGPLVSRGYLNDPDKTSKSFISDAAFINELDLGSGRRMYRTGDIVQQNIDGSLSFIGRSDDQIKIRGQRVEAGEIQYWVMKLLPEVRTAAVELIKRGEENEQVVLTVLLEMSKDSKLRGEALESGLLPPSPDMRNAFRQLRESLYEVLPSYMVPNAYIPFDRLPLNTSGKLDRRLVREKIRVISAELLQQYLSADAREVPSTQAEKLLQQLWAGALGIKDAAIGVHDHFFQIGGDSVIAMRVVSAARAARIPLTVAHIFQTPRLSELARIVERKQNHEEAPLEDVPRFALWKEIEGLTPSNVEARLEDIAGQCGIDRDQIEDIYPCTPLQEGLMAISTRKQRRAYVAQRTFRLGKAIQIERLKDAWEKLAEMLPILRTRIIPAIQSGSLQVIVRERIEWKEKFSLDTYLAEDLDEQEITYSKPLVHYAIVEVGDRNHQGNPERYFVWTAHHSVYDGWSMVRIFDLLARIYAGEPINQPAPFTRFLKYLNETDQEAVGAFWGSQLEGASAIDFPQLPRADYQPRVTKKVSHYLSLRQETGGQTAGSETKSSILRAAWAIVVSQNTGADEATLAVTLSGRSVPVVDVMNLVAPTIATVPVRIRIDPQWTIREYLERIQSQATEMIPFEHTGLQNIRRLVPDARLDPKHLFIVQASLEQDESTGAGFAGMEPCDTDLDDFDSYALNLECNVGNDGHVKIEARFDDTVLPEDNVRRLLQQLETVSSQLIDESGQRTLLRDLLIIGQDDVRQIREWTSDVPQSLKACIHDLVREKCIQQPHLPAVCAWDGDFTFGQLDVRAEQLARYLASLGVAEKPETVVGVCMEKSKWAVVAMLAILKVGGTVTLLGTQHPLARIKGILHDTAATVVLVDARNAERLSEVAQNGVTLTKVDLSLFAQLPEQTKPVSTKVHPNHAAFVVYTSGSTGLPNGVILEHTALCTSFRAHGKVYNMGQDTRTLQFAAYTFDVAIQDIFTTLYHGGCVCIPSEDERVNNLAAAMNRMQVNFANLTPTVAALLQPVEVPTLERLALGGEPVKSEILDLWTDHVELLNIYGVAECAINCSCSRPIKSNTEGQAANIGFPIGSRLWVADASNYHRLVPIGAPGELLVEGPLLARGYLNNKEKTIAAFVAEPAFVSQLGLHSEIGHRMYRTGDLVRQNVDGSLTFLGRRDNQIKIRGQRVEVGEIEQWVAQLLPRVRIAAVTLLQRDGGQASLALVVDFGEDTPKSVLPSGLLPPSSELEEAFHKLQASLIEVLPRYMVPSIYVPLAQLPLNSSGKLDRRAVQDFVASLTKEQLQAYLSSDTVKQAPSTDMERLLQKLWAGVLGTSLEMVGVNDHFVQAGGDSVTAMRMVAAGRLEQVSMMVADVFQYPRLSDLARVVESREKSEVLANKEVTQEQDAVPFALWKEVSNISPAKMKARLDDVAAQCGVTAEQIEDVYPCVPLQEGLIAISTQQQGAYVAQRVFRLSKTVSVARLRAAWEKLHEILPILRTRIMISGAQSGSVQVVIRDRIRWEEGTSLGVYLAEDREKGITYGGPLARYAIIQAGQDSQEQPERFFVWTTHHSMYDGWSLIKMLEMLAQIYAANIPVPKPAPFTRFLKYLDQIDFKTAKTFWGQQLEGASTIRFPALPYHLYRPRVTQRIVRRMGGRQQPTSETMSIVLRAAWAIVVAQYTGSNDTILAVALSGRNAPVAEVMDIVAPTITTVPVRIQINHLQTVRDFLRGIQHQAIEMIPFEHTGLQNIRRLVPKLGARLDPGHLFVVQAHLEHEATGIAGFEALEARETELEAFDDYPLSVQCTTGLDNNKIEVEARFDETVIPVEQMRQTLDQFEHVFLQLTGEDMAGSETSLEKRQISDLMIPSKRDSKQILAWNSSPPASVQACIHDLVQKWSNSRPEALAVCARDGELTYKELDTQAEQLADYLVGLGVGPEVMVALCLDKSKWAVLAMLAILKAGGVVVPLGIQHPIAYIDSILRDTNATIVLVDAQQARRLGGLVPHIVTINSSLVASLPLPAQTGVACRIVRPNQAAFVFYTSKSTRTSKGVILEHAGLCTSIQALGILFGIGSHSRALQFNAFTWHVTILDVFTTLSKGGCVCLPSEDDRITNLAGTIKAMNVNLVTLTSTIVERLRPIEVPTVETIILVGEAVRPAVIEVWASHAKIFNAYGSTECAVFASCTNPLTQRIQAPNLGLPVGTRLWVTDPSNYHRLCPIGTPGELLIEGPQLARAYLHNAERTAAAFITDPAFVKELGLGTGHRMYRTGDIVRQNPDGSLTYLGWDTQIKLSGQRVETSEIEYWVARLLADVRMVAANLICPGGDSEQAALVVVVEFSGNNSHGSKGTPASGLLPLSATLRKTFRQLRGSLFEVLPPYMVPSAYIPVERLPMKTSGKLDRGAVGGLINSLTSEDAMQYTLRGSFDETILSETEETLRALWAELLQVEHQLIRGDDILFQLGGDSIVVMKLVTAARLKGIHLTGADIFKHPSLSGMASLADQNRASEYSASLNYERFSLLGIRDVESFLEEAICPHTLTPTTSVVDVLPTTDFQALSVAGALTRSRVEFRYFQLDGDGPHDLQRLRQSFLELSSRIEILRTAYVFHQQSLLQVVLSSYTPDMPIYEIEDSIDNFSNQLLQSDMHRPPQLGQPLIDIAIVKSKTSLKHRIVFRMSHATYDAASIANIWATLQSIYEGQSPMGPAHFSSYVFDMSTRISPETYSYWRGLLRGSAMPQIVPASSPTQQNPFRMRSCPPQRVKLQDTPPEGINIAIVIKAAWASVLARHTGKMDVVFGEIFSGRNSSHPGVVNAVGCCATPVPVRVNFLHDWKAIELLRHIREQQLASIPHEALGFRSIIRQCTNWPTSTRFTSVVNHLQLPPSTMTLGDTEYNISTVLPQNDMSLVDVSIGSIPKGHHVEIELSYGANVPSETAKELSKELAVTVNRFLNSPEAPLANSLAAQTTQSKLSQETSIARPQPRETRQEQAKQSSTPTALDSRIVAVWQAVLNQRRGVRSSRRQPMSTFSDLGGDLVDAAYMAFLLQQQGLHVTIDDVLDYPTLESLQNNCVSKEDKKNGN